MNVCMLAFRVEFTISLNEAFSFASFKLSRILSLNKYVDCKTKLTLSFNELESILSISMSLYKISPDSF